MSTTSNHSPDDIDENEDAFLPPGTTITVVDVDFANRDDVDECHVFDAEGNHVAFAHLGGTVARSSIIRLPQVAGHPDQALVARALTATFHDGS